MSENRTVFRKLSATVMASGAIAASIYGYLSGIIAPDQGIFAGVIIGLAAKYLWEENGS